MALDYDEVERQLKDMQPYHKLYKLVQAEMKRRGHWKAKPRGKEFQKGHDERRGKL
jgi:hypothetical protein